MAEPLVIQFAADTSRAQSAMANLASQVVGNMTSIAVSMQGGAANSNSFGDALGMLSTNARRAASAVGADVMNITAATASAATRDRASLESVVGSFTAAAVQSQTAQAGVKAGVTATTTALTTLAAQVPTLKLLATGFVAFELGKLAFDAIAAAAGAASAQLEKVARIGNDANSLGVSTTFLQTYLGQARSLKLEADDLAKALETAKAAFTLRQGEGAHDARNQSPFEARLRQQAAAGNVTPEQVDRFAGARGFEAQNRAALEIIVEVQAKGKELAALDLAGRLFPPEIVERIRQGTLELDRFRRALDDVKNPDLKLFTPEEITRAQELQRRLDEAQRSLTDSGRDFNRLMAEAGARLKEDAISWTELMASGARGALAILAGIRRIAADFNASGAGLSAGGSADSLGAQLGTVAARSRTPPKPVADREMDDALDKLRGNLGNRTLIDQAQRASRSMTDALRPERTNPIVTGRPRSERGASEADPVETFVNGLEKQAAALKAETENFAKSNAEKAVAIQLAKAQEIAAQNGKTLTDAQTAAIRTASENAARYKDTLLDLEQAQRQGADTARYFGQALSDAFADAVIEGRTLGDVVSGLLKSLERSAIQAVFTGQGPLAGLFGTAAPASAPNAVGGLAGLVANGFGNAAGAPLPGAQGPTLPPSGLRAFGDVVASLFRANGGPVEAGQAYTVGERGRELFIPNRNGQIVPIEPGGGAAGDQYMFAGDHITITSAQGVTPQQMLAALAQRDAQFQRNINGIVATGRRRYARA